MTSIVLGQGRDGSDTCIDLPELLATRLLVQGNSGSGKSHLLRRLLEQTATLVQQIMIDPEGDFVTLAERYGHLVIDVEDQSESSLRAAGERVRAHRASVVLNLEQVEAEMQLRAAGAFLNGMFEAPARTGIRPSSSWMKRSFSPLSQAGTHPTKPGASRWVP